jgi:hypothetical protein
MKATEKSVALLRLWPIYAVSGLFYIFHGKRVVE